MASDKPPDVMILSVGGVHDAQADWAICMTNGTNIGPYRATAVNGFVLSVDG
jgi:hypothetical protein